MRKKVFCFNCEEEFQVSSSCSLPVEYCPFCGIVLNDDNHDDLEPDEEV